MLNIRPANEKDVETIMRIYNDAILNTSATFDTEIKTLDDRIAWFRSHDAQHPILVGEINNVVIGWASLTRWSDRCAYDGTAEVSVYVQKENRGIGVGKRLLEILVHEGEKAGLHYLLARISQGNEASIHIHTQL